MEGIQTRRRNAQNRFWLVVIILSVVAIVYLLYKPSSKKSAQGTPNKVVASPVKQTIIEKVQAVFRDPTDYGDYDYSTADMYIDNWQDQMGRPHYLAWDDNYSTTAGVDFDGHTEEEQEEAAKAQEKEEETEEVGAKENDEVKKADSEETQKPEVEDKTAEKNNEVKEAENEATQGSKAEEKTAETEKTAAASAGGEKDQIPPPSSSTNGLQDKLKTRFDGISADLTLLKTTDPLKIANIEFITSYKNPCFNDNASNFRCFPAFFIAGMPRCETKALHDILARHPAITAPDAHSPSFWTGNNQIPVEQYLDHFKQPSLAIKSLVTKGSTKDAYKALTFDSNPTLFWKGAITTKDSFMTPLHLKHLLPNSKIIIMVRDPIDRLYSEYMALVPKGTPESFETFAKASLEGLKKCEAEVKKLFSCIHRDLGDDTKPHLETGLYYLFYQEWIKSFTAAQILVLRMEDFDANKKVTVKKALEFLQVEDISDTVIGDMLKVSTKEQDQLPPMKTTTKKMLFDFYQPYSLQFAALLKNDALRYTRKDI